MNSTQGINSLKLKEEPILVAPGSQGEVILWKRAPPGQDASFQQSGRV